MKNHDLSQNRPGNLTCFPMKGRDSSRSFTSPFAERSRLVVTSFAVAALLCASRGALAAQATLDDFYKSMRNQTGAKSDDSRFLGLLLAVVALTLCIVAVKQWSTRRVAPSRPANNQKKLLAEAARQAGVSKKQVRQLEHLAKAEGISSPLVAIICPSVLKKLAGRAESQKQRDAISSLAKAMTKR